MLVEPADESVGRQLESPGGHPGAEGHKDSVTEESVGHAYLIGGLGEYVVEEVAELSEDEVRNNNKSSREDQIGDNPGSLEETKEGAGDVDFAMVEEARGKAEAEVDLIFQRWLNLLPFPFRFWLLHLSLTEGEVAPVIKG